MDASALTVKAFTSFLSSRALRGTDVNCETVNSHTNLFMPKLSDSFTFENKLKIVLSINYS